MKRLLTLLTIVMLFSLAACGDGDDGKVSTSNDKTPISSQPQKEDTPANQTEGEDNRNLEDKGGDFSYTKGKGPKWGKNEKVTPYFPAINDSKIIKEIFNNKVMYNIIVDWTKEEAEAYLNACKEAGYSFKMSDVSRIESDDTVVYIWHYVDTTYSKEVKITNEGDDDNWNLLLLK